jgi:hypothetical protein
MLKKFICVLALAVAVPVLASDYSEETELREKAWQAADEKDFDTAVKIYMEMAAKGDPA